MKATALKLLRLYLPPRMHLRLARHFTVWGLLSKPCPAEIEELISKVRMLTPREMRKLFPVRSPEKIRWPIAA